MVVEDIEFDFNYFIGFVVFIIDKDIGKYL